MVFVPDVVASTYGIRMPDVDCYNDKHIIMK
jgi:hypothetical protein